MVDLALPWRRGAPPLAKIAGEWEYLKREALYPARWIEGARDSGRRQKAQAQQVSALAREAPRIDPVATKIRWGERQEAAAIPRALPPLDLGETVREQGKSMRTANAPPAAASAAELRRARKMAITERLEHARDFDLGMKPGAVVDGGDSSKASE